jgi:hypothetical protein
MILSALLAVTLPAGAAAPADGDTTAVAIEAQFLQVHITAAQLEAVCTEEPALRALLIGDPAAGADDPARSPVASAAISEQALRRLVATPGGPTESKPAAGSDRITWEVIAAPRLVVSLHQPAAVTIGQSVTYLEPREDGCLTVVHQPDVFEGVELRVTVESIDAERVHFENLSFSLSRIVSREPIPDVPFDVGKPMIETRQVSTAFVISRDQVMLLRLPHEREDDPYIIVSVQASPAAEP